MENNVGKKRVGPRWLTETELKRALNDLYAGLTDEEESIVLSSSDEEASGKLFILCYVLVIPCHLCVVCAFQVIEVPS